MKKSNTFVFNLAWYEVLSEYAPEVRLEVYEAIMQYAATGTTGDLGPLSRMAFMFIKRELDYNRERYEEVSDKRREAGRKSAEVTKAGKTQQTPTTDNKGQQTPTTDNKGQQTVTNDNKDQQTVTNSNKDQQTVTNDNKDQQSSTNGNKGQQTVTNSIYNDIDNDIVYDIKETDKENGVPPDGETCRAQAPDAAVPFSQIMDFWNRAMNGKAIPQVSSLSPATKRGRCVKARFKEYGIDKIYQAILNTAESNFLNGHSSKGFIANFDWVFLPSNFEKVLDGNYKNNETDRQDRFSERRGTESSNTQRKGFKGTL